jgi:hypothetical protein
MAVEEIAYGVLATPDTIRGDEDGSISKVYYCCVKVFSTQGLAMVRKDLFTCGRKRPLTSATHHSPQTRETTNMHSSGPDAAGAAGKDGADLESSALHCPARDASALASPGIQALLEIHVQSSFRQPKDLRRDRDFEEARWRGTIGFGEPNVFVASCSSWVFTSANAPSRRT